MLVVAEVMSYEAALLSGIVAMAGAMGILWAKLSATDKRQQVEFESFKKQQDIELQECREFRKQFIDFLIGRANDKKEAHE